MWALATGCQFQKCGAQDSILKQLHKDQITPCLIWRIRLFTLAFGGLRNNLNENMTKTRCFFTNMTFKTHLCDSNHKKRRQKSSTIPSLRINRPSLLGNLLMFIQFWKGQGQWKVLVTRLSVLLPVPPLLVTPLASPKPAFCRVHWPQCPLSSVGFLLSSRSVSLQRNLVFYL